jgi:hypothetical protein
MTTTGLKLEINNLSFQQRKEVEKFIDGLRKKTIWNPEEREREFGYFKGKIKLADDFDSPLEDFSAYM